MTATYCILLDSGGRTSIHNGRKSCNGGTSREKRESAPGLLVNAIGTDLWSLLPTLSALRRGGGGDIQLLGPPDSSTTRSSVVVTLFLLDGPEEPGPELSRRIFDETWRDRAGKVVVCI